MRCTTLLLITVIGCGQTPAKTNTDSAPDSPPVAPITSSKVETKKTGKSSTPATKKSTEKKTAKDPVPKKNTTTVKDGDLTVTLLYVSVSKKAHVSTVCFLIQNTSKTKHVRLTENILDGPFMWQFHVKDNHGNEYQFPKQHFNPLLPLSSSGIVKAESNGQTIQQCAELPTNTKRLQIEFSSFYPNSIKIHTFSVPTKFETVRANLAVPFDKGKPVVVRTTFDLLYKHPDFESWISKGLP